MALVHTCKNCGTQFQKRHNPLRQYVFCSYGCRAAFASKQAQIEKACQTCGGKFSNIAYYGSQRFCSKACADRGRDQGKTPEAKRIRTSTAYANWRRAVFERDDHTCVICGVRGGKLNADHIKPFADHPELRLDVSNGRTLCVPCHLATDTFGNRRRRSEPRSADAIATGQEA